MAYPSKDPERMELNSSKIKGMCIYNLFPIYNFVRPAVAVVSMKVYTLLHLRDIVAESLESYFRLCFVPPLDA